MDVTDIAGKIIAAVLVALYVIDFFYTSRRRNRCGDCDR